MQPPGYMVGLEAPCLGSSCAWKDEIFVSRFQSLSKLIIQNITPQGGKLC